MRTGGQPKFYKYGSHVTVQRFANRVVEDRLAVVSAEDEMNVQSRAEIVASVESPFQGLQ